MYRQQKRVPTVLAILLIFFGLWGVFFLEKVPHQITSKAQMTIYPEEVHFTNISETSFTVSWVTSSPSIGKVILSEGGHSLIYFDDLDSDNIPRPRSSHHVSLKNLRENTSYNIKITGSSSCQKKEDCPSFTQKTAGKLTLSPSILPPARGTIVESEGKPASEAIVYLLVGKSAPLSARVDSAGLWVIPFNNLRSSDLLSRLPVADNDLVQITVKAAPSKKAEGVVDVKSIRENLTLPQMQIGNSYNFINLVSKKGLLAASRNQRILGTQAQTLGKITSTPTPSSFAILFPKEENETTIDSRPRLRGTAPPGKELTITVNSIPQTGRLIVGPDGLWEWRPSRNLSPGVHTITIQGYDTSGRPVSLSRKFIVLKSGESVLGEATPSATFTPTPPLSPSPFPSSTLVPTPLPSPTTLPTTLATTTPPPTGNLQPALFLLGTASFLILLGTKLILIP